ncbi:SDR family NAD(P)-dependent oxidoreductase [Nocardioides marmorisolisilvae]|uniref:SDR family oxidoreductase n=1 Tax=Nocardioides marmorisolisilvae TaxID=1542737 RepID=A0A3N0DTR4_9ACTN|nr:SDR family oxidoreductase [Nocardioides marmorisolisilvae]RNL78901.1 SDR family oxidoreductase [Nocardioides marmorisolisilvae]
MAELTGKVAVVTGGSRGLGREMVLAYAERGADVVIASRKVESCEGLAAEVTERFGVRALPLACNVSDWGQCDALVEQVHATFDRVDILVNNAGLSPLYPSLEEVSEALWDKVIGVNLKGPFRLSAAIGTRMAAAGGGCILNISSIASIRPDAISLPYAAAKAGLNALTEGFAQAFGPNVRVNGIICGPFDSDISLAWPDEIRSMVEGQIAQRRVGRPDEVVGAALHLTTDASTYTTGALLRVDGGTR